MDIAQQVKKKTLSTTHNLYNFKIEEVLGNEISQLILETSRKYSISTGQAVYILSQAQWRKDLDTFAIDEMIDVLYPNVPKEIEQQKNNTECLVCFEELNAQNRYSLQCKHYFCKECFKNYLVVQTREIGSDIIFKTCPLEGCHERLNFDCFEALLTQEYQDKYTKFVLNNVLLNSVSIIKCPEKNCNIVLSSTKDDANLKGAQFNVQCKCNKFFCNLCKEDSHKPLSCERLIEWRNLLGGADGDDDQAWIRVNSKPCPKCNINIEKNQGCNHMTCSKCKFDFCWLCLKPYRGHSSCIQNNQTYNGYDNSEEKRRKRFDFYQRLYLNYKSSVFHTNLSKKVRLEKLQEFEKNISDFSTHNFDFYENSLKLIVEARKAIQYSFPIAYFIDNENEKQLLEQQQDVVNQKLEILDSMVNIDLEQKFFNKKFFNQKDKNLTKTEINDLSDKYAAFKQEIIDKTSELEKLCNNMFESFAEYLPKYTRSESKIVQKVSSIMFGKKAQSKLYSTVLNNKANPQQQNQSQEVENSQQLAQQPSKTFSKQYSMNFQNVENLCIECEKKQATNDLEMCEECYQDYYGEK